MDASNHILGVLALAFSLGLVHALDADHLMAVATLSGSRPGFKQSLGFCSRWAMGHGSALLLISLSVLVLQWAIPVSLSHVAEQLVGLVLILLGLLVFRDIVAWHMHLHAHTHNEPSLHAHWHRHDRAEIRQAHEHQHRATLVGLLHGAAGSAPLLALLPAGRFASPWTGMAYVLVFGLGVFTAMLIIGGLLGRLFVLTQTQGKRVSDVVRGAIASGSIIYGAYLLGGVNA